MRIHCWRHCAAVVVDPVKGRVPFLDRADGQAARRRIVDGGPWFVLDEQRRAMIPCAFVITVTDAENLRHVDITLPFETILAT